MKNLIDRLLEPGSRWLRVTTIALALLPQVPGLQAQTVAVGSYHGLGIPAGGGLVSWGGVVTLPGNYPTPLAVSAGKYHQLALQANGKVAAFGDNFFHQCDVPADLSTASLSATRVTAICAGTYHNLALLSDQTVVAWGQDAYFQSDVPAGLAGVVALAAGQFHSLALKADGSVVQWGSIPSQGTAILAPSGVTFTAIAAGVYHSLGLTSTGTVVGWGYNTDGQLALAGTDHAVAIAAGGRHSLVLKDDGSVLASGVNSNHECDVPPDLQVPGPVVAIGAGETSSMALLADGTLRVWGSLAQSGVANVLFRVPAPNHAPSADAGPGKTVSYNSVATTTLVGTASDADGDTLDYRWLENGNPLSPYQLVAGGNCPLNLGTLAVPLAMGQHILTLQVTDGKATTQSDMALIIENSPPDVSATGAGTYSVGDLVTLGGTVSDLDGDFLSYQWVDGATTLFASTAMNPVATILGGAPVSLPNFNTSFAAAGTHYLTLSVSDGVNQPVYTTIQVKVTDVQADTQPPTLAPTLNKNILWPPNGTMVPVTIHANASDSSGLPVILGATVACNEPNQGAPFWTAPVIDQGSGTITLALQATRSGKGLGRFYTITIQATDQAGNTSHASVVVTVPHDQGKN